MSLVFTEQCKITMMKTKPLKLHCRSLSIFLKNSYRTSDLLLHCITDAKIIQRLFSSSFFFCSVFCLTNKNRQHQNKWIFCKEKKRHTFKCEFLWYNMISLCFTTNEGMLKCKNQKKERKKQNFLHILFDKYVLWFIVFAWVATGECVHVRVLFMFKQEKFAKHNKSPKRMQSTVHWAAMTVRTSIPLTNDAMMMMIMPVMQIMLVPDVHEDARARTRPPAFSFIRSVCISFPSINRGSSVFILSQWRIEYSAHWMYLPIKLLFKSIWMADANDNNIKKWTVSLLLLLKRYLSPGRLRARFNRQPSIQLKNSSLRHHKNLIAIKDKMQPKTNWKRNNN